MSIKQTKDGWKVDFRAGGANGKRYRKTCRTKAEAERYQKFVEAQSIATGKPWNDKPNDPRRLSELINVWYQHSGQHKKYSAPRLRKLLRTCDSLSNPIAAKLTKAEFSAHRSNRLEAGRSPVTVNMEFDYLATVYNELSDIGEIDYEFPLKGLKYLSTPEREMAFLDKPQINQLLAVLQEQPTNDLELISLVCLNIGARWGEAQNLKKSQIQKNKITLFGTGTKNGRSRSIPINEYLYSRLKMKGAKKAPNEPLFNANIEDFYKVMRTLEFNLPKGQNTHVLRHTFASHFVINGGNILTLQKILDHTDIKVTLKYAHLAPDHLTDAIKFNPMNAVDTSWTLENDKAKKAL